MFQTLRNAWKIEDLRKKLLFTLLILVIVRLGCAIPVPFLDPSRLQEMLDSTQGNLLGYLNLLTGGDADGRTVGIQCFQPAAVVDTDTCGNSRDKAVQPGKKMTDG